MAAPSVYIDGQEISSTAIETAHLIFDIDKLYALGALVLKDPGGMLGNVVKRGADVRILYASTSGRQLVAHPLRVLTYEKTGTAGGEPINKISATLVSEWYYKQVVRTRAFFGTVSDIIKKVTENEFWFSKIKLEKSSDSTRVRYQVGQTTAEYLATIKKYAVADGSAMFLYTNRFRELRLASKATLCAKSPEYRLAPFMSAEEYRTGYEELPIISATAMAFYSEGQEAAAFKLYKFPVRNATEMEQASLTPMLAITSAESAGGSAITASAPAVTRFSNWTISPAETMAMATNKVAREEMDLFYCVAIVGNILNSAIDIGSVLYIDINRASPENGKYFVKHIDVMYNGGESFTKLMLCKC